MAISLKPIDEQVIVIVGASSGIGLATARVDVKKGAKVVVAARNGDALRQFEQEISSAGGQALAVTADVTRPEDVQRIAQQAIERFGGFDTWFNNAGIGMYGKAQESDVNDAHQLFEINFWGEVNGCNAALPHLKQRGGALINMGSTESDRTLPLHSFYAATKHAVQAYTDGLRMELEKEGAPVSVTLIKPGAIDTPFPEHAKNYMEKEANLPAPIYDPDVVAHAVLHAASHPERDIWVGGGGKFIATSGKYAPRFTDKFMNATMWSQQVKEEPNQSRDALWEPSDGMRQRGNHQGHVMKSSLYTSAALHPVLTGLVIGAAGAAIVGAIGAASAASD
jgi:NADP-dependent 3-hydroxy acid dehydrogenase YdfG